MRKGQWSGNVNLIRIKISKLNRFVGAAGYMHLIQLWGKGHLI